MAEYGRVGSASDYMKEERARAELEGRRGGPVFPKGELNVPRDEEALKVAEPKLKVIRVADEYGNLKVDGLEVDVQISYSASSPEPFSYMLEFPDDAQLKQFFVDARLTTSLGGKYYGERKRAYTADQVRTFAQTEIDKITSRFKAYIVGKNQAKTYTYTSRG